LGPDLSWQKATEGDLNYVINTIHPEEIIHTHREADVLLGQGRTVPQVCKQLGVSDRSYYRWRKAYDGMKVNQAKRLKQLGAENARLKPAVADLTIDKLILKKVAEGR
jgi:hypothetical protein